MDKFLDHDEFDALLQERSGGRMMEVVEEDAALHNLTVQSDRAWSLGVPCGRCKALLGELNISY